MYLLYGDRIANPPDTGVGPLEDIRRSFDRADLLEDLPAATCSAGDLRIRDTRPFRGAAIPDDEPKRRRDGRGRGSGDKKIIMRGRTADLASGKKV